MSAKVNFRFEADEDCVTWKVEIPRTMVLAAIKSNNDTIWFEGTFDIPPAQCKSFIELLNTLNKK